MNKGSMMGEKRTMSTSSNKDMDMISGIVVDMDARKKHDTMPKVEMMPKEMLMPGMGKGKGTKRDIMMEKPKVEMKMMEENGMMAKDKMMGHGIKRDMIEGNAMMKGDEGHIMVTEEDEAMMGTQKGNMMKNVKHTMMRPEMGMGKGLVEKGMIKDMNMRKRGMMKGNMMMEKEKGMNMDV